MQGVEIIFEDEQYNEEMFGLYAWFNERRARDDSKNIRRNLRHKIEEGDLLVKAIYGYNKDGKQLVIYIEFEVTCRDGDQSNSGQGFKREYNGSDILKSAFERVVMIKS